LLLQPSLAVFSDRNSKLRSTERYPAIVMGASVMALVHVALWAKASAFSCAGVPLV
jgi:hypothetical protein